MTTLGVLTPHTTPGPELEIPAMSEGRVSTLLSRIPVRGGAPEQLRDGTHPSVLDEAAAALPAGSVDALAYASTSSGYAIGAAGEGDLVARLRHRWQLPVVSSGLAVVEALHAYGIARVTVVHPPWFDDEASELGANYFRAQGVHAVVVRADSLPREPAEVRPHHVTDWVVAHLDDASEAVFFGGNGFRTAAAIDAVERQTGALVLTANQVLLWAVLRETNTALPISGCGRLFHDWPPGTVPNVR